MPSIKAGIKNKLVSMGFTPYVYHYDLPQNPRYPATVYWIVDDFAIGHTHDPLVVGFRKARVQIDVYALTIAEVENAMESYVAALAGYIGNLSDGQSPETVWDVSIFDEGENPPERFKDQAVLKEVRGRSHDFMLLY